MRRWLATPYYGALLAPVWLIVRDVLLAIAGAVAGGAAAVIALRRIRRG
jgi:hypothetical protein